MEVRDVNFSYNGTDAILKNVSFTIQKNKINTIVGPNGSGKSTLLEILARLLSPNSGMFYWKENRFLNGKQKNLRKMWRLFIKVTFFRMN